MDKTSQSTSAPNEQGGNDEIDQYDLTPPTLKNSEYQQDKSPYTIRNHQERAKVKQLADLKVAFIAGL